VRVVEGLDRFQFGDDSFLDQQVDINFPDDCTIVPDSDALLIRDDQTEFAQLVRQRVFEHFSKKSSAERVQDLKCVADNALRQPIHSGLICVHLRASSVEIPCFVSCMSGAAIRVRFALAIIKI
jgi:hypothetical protein